MCSSRPLTRNMAGTIMYILNKKYFLNNKYARNSQSSLGRLRVKLIFAQEAISRLHIYVLSASELLCFAAENYVVPAEKRLNIRVLMQCSRRQASSYCTDYLFSKWMSCASNPFVLRDSRKRTSICLKCNRRTFFHVVYFHERTPPLVIEYAP